MLSALSKAIAENPKEASQIASAMEEGWARAPTLWGLGMAGGRALRGGVLVGGRARRGGALAGGRRRRGGVLVGGADVASKYKAKCGLKRLHPASKKRLMEEIEKLACEFARPPPLKRSYGKAASRRAALSRQLKEADERYAGRGKEEEAGVAEQLFKALAEGPAAAVMKRRRKKVGGSAYTDFLKEYGRKNGITYGEAMIEVKKKGLWRPRR